MIYPVLIAAVLGGALYLLSKPSAVDLENLASRTTNVMPRGERAFKPEVARGIVDSLSSLLYSWPTDDRHVVKLRTSDGVPISPDLSAMGWVKSMNATQSILAMLTTATTSTATQMLRACAPGLESSYASPGGAYAVLLYPGGLLSPPGIPPLVADPNAPLPADPLQWVRDELGSHPELSDAVITLLQMGRDSTALQAMAAQFEAYGVANTAALLRKRAAELLQGKAA